MTITLTPDVENALAEQARRQGTTPEQIVLDTLREKLAAVSGEMGESKGKDDIEPRDDWEKLVLGVGVATGVSLSDEATSRETVYGGHL